MLIREGTLSPAEFEEYKNHTTYGSNICMEDPELRPYSDGPLYHHEALDGSGYPFGITDKDIPFVAKIIRVADEYDSLVSKRHFNTHIHISNTLKDLINGIHPDDIVVSLAFGQLSENSKIGKMQPEILKALFELVIEDINSEITAICKYVDSLKVEIDRLKLIDHYYNKMQSTSSQKKIDYYKEGICILLHPGETIDNYQQILLEYNDTTERKNQSILELMNEIKIIKKLNVLK